MAKTGENLEKDKRKTSVHQKTTTKLKAHLSGLTTESRRQPKTHSKWSKGKNCQQISLQTAKTYFKNEGEIKNFPKAKTEITCCQKTCFIKNINGIFQLKDYNSKTHE